LNGWSDFDQFWHESRKVEIFKIQGATQGLEWAYGRYIGHGTLLKKACAVPEPQESACQVQSIFNNFRDVSVHTDGHG